MKAILIYIFILPVFLLHSSDSPNDFDRKLSNIASDFREHIFNKDDCEDLMHDASRVSEDIEQELREDDKYSENDRTEYKAIQKKADALESFIGCVSGCSNTIPTIVQFNLANALVGGSVGDVVQGKFCIDFISLSIDKYKAYLGENNTTSNYTVNYKWKAPSGMNSGSGSMGLTSKCVRHICDNREKPAQNGIIIFGVSCELFKF